MPSSHPNEKAQVYESSHTKQQPNIMKEDGTTTDAQEPATSCHQEVMWPSQRVPTATPLLSHQQDHQHRQQRSSIPIQEEQEGLLSLLLVPSSSFSSSSSCTSFASRMSPLSVGTFPRDSTMPRFAPPRLLRRAGAGAQVFDIELQEHELTARRQRFDPPAAAKAKLLSILERAAALINEDDDE
jgi:hypothetical protein